MLFLHSICSENKNNSRCLNLLSVVLFGHLQTCIYFVFQDPVIFISFASDNSFRTDITLKGIKQWDKMYNRYHFLLIKIKFKPLLLNCIFFLSKRLNI